ncbi:MAG TPA: hypothetical protein VF342_14735 [Alphaproteobacteria bacterium]
MKRVTALSAALSAYHRSCRSGVAPEVAMSVATARYQAFFPVTPGAAVRNLLTIALQQDRALGRLVLVPSPDRMSPGEEAARH